MNVAMPVGEGNGVAGIAHVASSGTQVAFGEGSGFGGAAGFGHGPATVASNMTATGGPAAAPPSHSYPQFGDFYNDSAPAARIGGAAPWAQPSNRQFGQAPAGVGQTGAAMNPYQSMTSQQGFVGGFQNGPGYEGGSGYGGSSFQAPAAAVHNQPGMAMWQGHVQMTQFGQQGAPSPAGGSLSLQQPPPAQANGPPCWCNQPSIEKTTFKEGPNQNRKFYCCVKPQSEGRCGFFQWTDEPPKPPPSGPNCACGVPSREAVVRKEGPNQGRPIFVCAARSCEFFAWGDDPQAGQPQQQGPPCQCGNPTLTHTVRKEGANMGRTFFRCARSNGKECDYFQWTDEEPAPMLPPGPPCQCGQPTKSRICQKEGANKGRTFHCCTRPNGQDCFYFQWADEPPAPMLPPGPPCACGQPTRTRLAGKDGPNKGRAYHRCARATGQDCDYFQWADEPPRPMLPPGPNCQCGKPSRCRTVQKEGDNKGRPFYSCAKSDGQVCDYFQWADEAPSGGGGGNRLGVPTPLPPGPPCNCGHPSAGKIVRKEGPNKGRPMYVCARQNGQDCQFFQWGDEMQQQGGFAGPSAYNHGAAPSAYNQGGQGHNPYDSYGLQQVGQGRGGGRGKGGKGKKRGGRGGKGGDANAVDGGYGASDGGFGGGAVDPSFGSSSHSWNGGFQGQTRYAPY